MLRGPLSLLLILLATGCAPYARLCYDLSKDHEWVRIDGAPKEIDNAFLKTLFNSGRQPDPTQIAWYQRSPTEYRACWALIRDSHGCGDHVVGIEITNGEASKTGHETITVC